MMLPSRRVRSLRSVARQKIAMTSEATVMSKPSSRGKPLATPPSEPTMLRSARSFMSMTRRQVMRRSSMPELVAPVDVVVDQRGQQVVGGADGVEVAGEVEVDVLHRHDLGIAAAGGAALDAEAGPEARLAQADDRLLADGVEAVAQADRGRGLALAGRGRGDGGDQDQLAVGPLRLAVDEIERDLGLVAAIGIQLLRRDAELGRDLLDRQHLRRPGDFDIAQHLLGHWWFAPP